MNQFYRKCFKLWQYKIIISLTVELILAFTSNTDFVREVNSLSPNKRVFGKSLRQKVLEANKQQFLKKWLSKKFQSNPQKQKQILTKPCLKYWSILTKMKYRKIWCVSSCISDNKNPRRSLHNIMCHTDNA